MCFFEAFDYVCLVLVECLEWWFSLKMLTLMNNVNDVELNDGVYVFVYVDELWYDNHVVGCWCEWYMLNVDCWLRIYTCLMLIIRCGDCMYRIMLLNSYMQFDDDNCGACIYERCLFFVLIIWWMIHAKCQLLIANVYMLNVDIWLWWLHELNYVVEFLYAIWWW